MIELEENSRLLENMSKKIKELGESLWHTKTKRRIDWAGATNSSRKFLEW